MSDLVRSIALCIRVAAQSPDAILLRGIAAASMAGCHSYGAIIVCRLFIGLGESIFGQAVVLHYSLWVSQAPKHEHSRV